MAAQKKKSAPSKTVAKKTKKPEVKTKASAAKKPVAQKPAVKKAAAAKVVAKKKPAKKAATPKKTAAPKKAAPAKAVSKKVVKKAAPKKVAPAKKAAPQKPVQKVVAAKPVKKEPKTFSEILRDAALKVLDERQAEDIVTVNLQGRSAMADYALIASGRSGRQLAAIADYLREAFLKAGVKQVRVEGLSQADWVLIDAGDILIHLFRPEVRRYYQIEDIWSASPPKA